MTVRTRSFALHIAKYSVVLKVLRGFVVEKTGWFREILSSKIILSVRGPIVLVK